jgi:hypothetical protein
MAASVRYIFYALQGANGETLGLQVRGRNKENSLAAIGFWLFV